VSASVVVLTPKLDGSATKGIAHTRRRYLVLGSQPAPPTATKDAPKGKAGVPS
jgi:hypothetical protein